MNLDYFLTPMLFLTQINDVQMDRRNVAIHKQVHAITLHPASEWSVMENIVDGDLRRDGNKCRCCAATNHTRDPWITVDLEREYIIDLVTVYGRTDDKCGYLPQSFRGLQIHLVNASQIQDNGVYTVGGTCYVNFANVSLNDVKTRFVTLLLPGKKELPVCELEVYGSECKSGMYGVDCNQTCGCYNTEPCEVQTGDCKGCPPGYTGPKCLAYCSPGTYGRNCSQICGYCSAGENCNHVNGSCIWCSPGYQGLDCKQECDTGTYGEGCKSLCGQCKRYETCHHVIGHCLDGCAAGRQGDLCKQACVNGTFGVDCSHKCNCLNNETCDPFTGACDNEACAEDTSHSSCQQIREKESEVKVDTPQELVSNLVLIVIFTVLSCGNIALLTVVICLLRRKRKSEAKMTTDVTKGTVEHPYDDLQIEQNQL